MKIIFICGAGLVSGKEIQTLHTMVQMKKMGHEIHCIMSSWGSADFATLLRNNGIQYTQLRLGFISKTLSFSAIMMTLHQAMYVPYLWFLYRRFVRSIRPDYVIHTNFHHLFLLLPAIKRGGHIFYAHDPFPPSRFIRYLFRRFDRKIDLFVGVSKFITKGLLQLGLPEKKVVCVYNGIRIDPRSEDHFPPGGKPLVVGIVGQVGQWKGHEVLIEAIEPILRESDARLRIVGDGVADYVAHLKEVVKQKDIEQNVSFTGRISGLYNIYRDIDILCIPSLFQEPFGLTAAEAGLFRIPVISSGAGGLPEIIENGITGLVLPAGNVQDLREALVQLITDPGKRKAMGEAARARVIRHFTIETSAAELFINLQKLSRK